MLKIKDNIDLKELEKYGFIKDQWGWYEKEIYYGRRGQSFEIMVSKNKIIQGYANGADGSGEESPIDDTLYNLIKDDLVEKVKE